MTAEASDIVELVIPTYERLTTLRRAVESALAKTRFRVTVLDDNSPSPAADALADLSAGAWKDRLRVIRNPYNLGASLNILRSLEVSRARYTWTFADDRVVTDDSETKILDSIELAPRAAVHYWNRGLPEGESTELADLAAYVGLIERDKSVYGFSDNFYHRVIDTEVGRSHVRVDARFCHGQPTLGIQLAALGDGHPVRVTGGEVSGYQPEASSSWSPGYAYRFKFDPAYLFADPDLRRRYRSIVARHFPWRSGLINLPDDRRGTIEEAFGLDAARMVCNSDLPLGLRAEARLALFLRTNALGRILRRAIPSRGFAEEPVDFEEMNW